jgi:hypothetical protein
MSNSRSAVHILYSLGNKEAIVKNQIVLARIDNQLSSVYVIIVLKIIINASMSRFEFKHSTGTLFRFFSAVAVLKMKRPLNSDSRKFTAYEVVVKTVVKNAKQLWKTVDKEEKTG